MASEPILNEGSKFRSRDETKINPKTWFGSTNGWRLEAHDADAETTPPETTPIVGAPAATFESTTAAEHTETGAQLKHTHTHKRHDSSISPRFHFFFLLSVSQSSAILTTPREMADAWPVASTRPAPNNRAGRLRQPSLVIAITAVFAVWRHLF